jgi:hypothetical protein
MLAGIHLLTTALTTIVLASRRDSDDPLDFVVYARLYGMILVNLIIGKAFPLIVALFKIIWWAAVCYLLPSWLSTLLSPRLALLYLHSPSSERTMPVLGMHRTKQHVFEIVAAIPMWIVGFGLGECFVSGHYPVSIAKRCATVIGVLFLMVVFAKKVHPVRMRYFCDCADLDERDYLAINDLEACITPEYSTEKSKADSIECNGKGTKTLLLASTEACACRVAASYKVKELREDIVELRRELVGKALTWSFAGLVQNTEEGSEDLLLVDYLSEETRAVLDGNIWTEYDDYLAKCDDMLKECEAWDNNLVPSEVSELDSRWTSALTRLKQALWDYFTADVRLP